MPNWKHELALGIHEGVIVCGVDEVGRGPLAGPVMACAVILEYGKVKRKLARRLDDSKKIPAPAREEIAAELRATVTFGLGSASVEEIDSINILQASLLAMQRAVAALAVSPAHALVDGNRGPNLHCPCTCVIGGDGLSLSIAAASIIAKVERDKIMRELAEAHPLYGWDHNVGYSTAGHLAALQQHGATRHHRHSFRPVYELDVLIN